MISGWRRWRRIWRRTPARDVDAELQFHLDERIAELMAAGADADHARTQALREFGDMPRVRDGLVDIDQRITRRRAWRERFEWIGQDLSYVLRSLRRSPGFVVAVVVTLALGLGANAAVFSLLNRLYLRTPPGIVHPDAVHRIYRVDPRVAASGLRLAQTVDMSSVFSYDDFALLQRTLPAGAVLSGYATDDIKLGRGSAAASLRVQFVLGDFFRVLGVPAVRGRLFQQNELRIEGPTPVAVIGNALWRGHFGADPSVVGKTVDLNYHKYTIVGVAPPGFQGPDNDAADLWAPMNMMGTQRGGAQWYVGGHGAWIRVLAVERGAGATQALEHAATLAFRQTVFRPDSTAQARIASLVDPTDGGWQTTEVTISTRLAGVAMIILLIASANVANLFLARGMRRRRELALRLALGVSRRRLISLLLLESLAVSLIGALVAVGLAFLAGKALLVEVLPDVHWSGPVVDIRVLGFTIGLAIVVGIGAGLWPALRTSQPSLTASLKGGARDGMHQRSRMRTVLLLAQSALSVVLLAGAGLLVRSLRSVETEPIGYDVNRIVYAEVRADPDHTSRAADVHRRLPPLADAIRQMPGVEVTALAAITPMQGFSWIDLFTPDGDSMPHVPANGPFISYVSPSFFAAMGMHVLQGRGLATSDRADDSTAMVVSQTMARSYWPRRPAVGECLVLGHRSGRCVPIVGVVSDGHYDGIIETPSMQFYLPLADSGSSWTAGVIVIRAAPGSAARVASHVRQRLAPEFADWAEISVHTMHDDLAGELRPWRAGAALFSAAGLLALLVAMVGVYSTIAYTFSQRIHEIGVRMALGARAVSVARLVIGDGLRVVGVGVVIGVLLSLGAGRLIASMLYKTSPHDPLVLVSVSIVLLLVAALACAIPAWRASRVDPVIALRAE